MDQEGSWSEWTSWTPCSRTCGGGVSAQMRHCRTLRSRRSVTRSPLRNRRRASDSSDDLNHLNALDTTTAISANSSSRTTGCVGLYKRYHMCNTQECPARTPDFRQAQCESYNGKQFMGRYYIWEAYWDAENPCELNCRALTFRFYALLNKTVIDGTLCRPNDPTRVCVSGTCK
ncbi:hypothetical protein OUZ56_003000 [Daphnia magna]|uniref:Uncharacterized protein n=3 Tax=Daphnia magna TaxID=35525 RepID=A0ABR0A7Q6_9CRUS|nr:hypothetical protein OUZ56_003000 [Daphnia magna]